MAILHLLYLENKAMRRSVEAFFRMCLVEESLTCSLFTLNLQSTRVFVFPCNLTTARSTFGKFKKESAGFMSNNVQGNTVLLSESYETYRRVISSKRSSQTWFSAGWDTPHYVSMTHVQMQQHFWKANEEKQIKLIKLFHMQSYSCITTVKVFFFKRLATQRYLTDQMRSNLTTRRSRWQ